MRSFLDGPQAENDQFLRMAKLRALVAPGFGVGGDVALEIIEPLAVEARRRDAQQLGEVEDQPADRQRRYVLLLKLAQVCLDPLDCDAVTGTLRLSQPSVALKKGEVATVGADDFAARRLTPLRGEAAAHAKMPRS